MTELKRRRKIELANLRSDGFDNSCAAMTGVRAPKAPHAVEDRTALGSEIMDSLGRNENTRVSLERTICGKRHPVSVKIVSQTRFSCCRRSHGRRPPKGKECGAFLRLSQGFLRKNLAADRKRVRDEFAAPPV
jgi:hypothetical protein